MVCFNLITSFSNLSLINFSIISINIQFGYFDCLNPLIYLISLPWMINIAIQLNIV